MKMPLLWTFMFLLFGTSFAYAQGGTSFGELCKKDSNGEIINKDIINCWGFENENRLYYGWDENTPACANDSFLQNHVNGHNATGLHRQQLWNIKSKVTKDGSKCVYPKRDNVQSVSGGHSLRFDYEWTGGSNPSGNFMPVFKRKGTSENYRFAQFGKGGEFWVRFRMRQNPALLNYVFIDESGKTASMKRTILHGYSNSSKLEETITRDKHGPIPNLYSDQGFESYGVQEAVGCERFPHGDMGYPEPPCRRFKPDVWQTFEYHVKVSENVNDGVVDLYFNGELIVHGTNSNMEPGNGHIMQTLPYTEDAIWGTVADGGTNGYGKLTFTLHSTRRDSNIAPPAGASMWIDDIIVSHTRMPPISNDTIAPAEPTNLISD